MGYVKANGGRTGRIGFVVLTAGLVLAGATACAGSFVSPQWIIARANALARRGNAQLSPEHLRHALLLLRAAGCGLLALAGAGWLCRSRVQRATGKLLEEFGSSQRRLRQDARAALGGFSKAQWMALGGVTVVGAAIRVARLFQPMLYDEAGTYVIYASRPMILFMAHYGEPNNQIFHTLLVHWSTMLFGNHPWAIRLPALIAGILVIPVTAVVFGRIFSRRAGLLAAGLAAGWSVLIEYSVNARGYTLVTLFFLLLLGLAAYLKGRRNFAGWVIFAVIGGLGIYTIPVMVFPLGSVILWLILSDWRNDSARPRWHLARAGVTAGAAALLLAGVCYAPVLFARGLAPITANRYVKPLPMQQFLHGRNDTSNYLGPAERLWSLWNRDLPTAVAVLLGLAAAASAIFHGRVARDKVPVVGAVVLWCAAVVAEQRNIPPERVWLFLAPLYLAMAAAGIGLVTDLLLPRWRGALSACVPIAAALGLWAAVVCDRSGYRPLETGYMPDASAIAPMLAGLVRPGDLVLAVVPADGPLIYYAQAYPEVAKAIAEGQDHRPGRRAFIVVRTQDQTPASVIGLSEFPEGAFEAPRLIATFPDAAVYEANPQKSGADAH